MGTVPDTDAPLSGAVIETMLEVGVATGVDLTVAVGVAPALEDEVGVGVAVAVRPYTSSSVNVPT